MDLMLIENTDLAIKEYNGQMVVTFKDIDAVHQRPNGTARNAFKRNKKHFIEGEDYFVCQTYEAMTRFGIKAPNGLVVMTEAGYLMISKTFTDDLSWKVQRALVNTYFRYRESAQNRVESKISDYMIPSKKNFYERNKDAIWALCKARDITPKELYTDIIRIIGNKYNLDGIKRYYTGKTGIVPVHMMDVVDFIPEVSDTADMVLGKLIYNATKA